MKKEFLQLVPKRYLCPVCGEWHEWMHKSLGWYNSEDYMAIMKCPKLQGYADYEQAYYSIYFEDNRLYCKIENLCSYKFAGNVERNIPISLIKQIDSEFKVGFYVDYYAVERIGKLYCDCGFSDTCEAYRSDKIKDGSGVICKIPLGFEFEISDYMKAIELSQSPKENEKPKKQKSTIQLKEGETSMAKNEIKERTTLWDQLYRHAPEENVAIVKDWCRKYKSTLAWAIPVVGIYAAYRILKSKDSNITVDNINKINKKTGLNFEELKNKEALRQLMVLGGVIAGGYALSKIIPKLNGKNGEETLSELNVEQLEETMDAAEKAKNKFGFLGPKAEALFPVATSVIIIYLMTQKPKWFEDLKANVIRAAGSAYTCIEAFLGLARAFVTNILHIDLKDEDEVKKFKRFFILGVFVLISVFLFGKKVLGKDAEVEQDDTPKNEKMETFVSELTNIMKKLMPTAFTALVTILVTGKILKANGDQTPESEEDEENDEDDESLGYIDRIVDPEDDLESEENMSSDSETEENNEDSSEDDEPED